MRKATMADLPYIVPMVKRTIAEMHSYNNHQWDETYPQESDFAEDIEKGELFVAERNGRLAGFVCINQVEPAEYQGVPWSKEKPAFVIHRWWWGQNTGARELGRNWSIMRQNWLDIIKLSI